MTLLELITNAASNPEKRISASQSVIVLNPNESLLNLKPQTDDWNEATLIKPLIGWKISETDEKLLKSAKKLLSKLNRRIKNTRRFSKEEIDSLLCSFLKKNAELLGVSITAHSSYESHTLDLVKKLGFTIGHDVIDLMTIASADFEHWELLKVLIINKFVGYSNYPSLIAKLVDKRRADYVCLAVRYLRGLQASEILCVLKYFLTTDGDDSMVTVREDWGNAANLVIEKLTDKTTKPRELSYAKKASILLMIAYDEFSDSDLCLHYLLAYLDLDDVIFSSAIKELDVAEVMSFVAYLSKWLKKYERFPQAVPCLKKSSIRWSKACEWIPSLENLVKCFNFVVDEHFSSLVFHPEFHQGLRTVYEVATSLASEAKLCCFVANIVDNIHK